MAERRASEWAGVFFSDIITLKGQMQQEPGKSNSSILLSHPSRSRKETLRFQTSLRARMEPEQSSLYRRHTKPFESWEPFFLSPFLYLFLPILPSFLPSLTPTRFAAPLSFAEQLFSQLGVFLRRGTSQLSRNFIGYMANMANMANGNL